MVTLILPSEGLSFDWIRKKLYWADWCTQTIEVYDTNSGTKTTLYNVARPTDVAVDPFNGYGCGTELPL